MVKTVGFMPRRPDISREAFRVHCESRHAPLALAYFPFVRYVRNHVVASRPDPIGFDCLSEFWVDDVGEIHALMESEIGDIMREDELRFTDQPRIGPALAEEFHLFGPLPEREEKLVAKEALLLIRQPGTSDADFVAAIRRWSVDLARSGGPSKLAFDRVTPFADRHFPPCHAILYGWIDDGPGTLFDAEPPAAIGIHARLLLQAIESPES